MIIEIGKKRFEIEEEEIWSSDVDGRIYLRWEYDPGLIDIDDVLCALCNTERVTKIHRGTSVIDAIINSIRIVFDHVSGEKKLLIECRVLYVADAY